MAHNLNEPQYTLGDALILLVVGIVITLGLSHVLEPKSDSFESHLVYNYINEHAPNMINRFDEINGNWPPSRQEMATLLLDAQRQVQLAERTKKQGN